MSMSKFAICVSVSVFPFSAVAIAEPVALDSTAVTTLIVGHTVTEPEMSLAYKKDGTVVAKSKKKKFLNFAGTYKIQADGQVCITNPAQSYCDVFKKDGDKYMSGNYPILSIK